MKIEDENKLDFLDLKLKISESSKIVVHVFFKTYQQFNLRDV